MKRPPFQKILPAQLQQLIGELKMLIFGGNLVGKLGGLSLTQTVGRREKTPSPKTRFSIWTLLRTPGRFTTRPLPVHFTTKMSVVRPFSVLSKDEIGL